MAAADDAPGRGARVEDEALLRGAGRYADDMPAPPGTLHAAVLRSPHPHALIRAIDPQAARAMPGVAAVVAGPEIAALTRPFAVGVKAAMEHWCVAMERARYVGEPVALVLAKDRYRAEDALAKIAVDYEPLPALVEPERAAAPDAPLLHPAVGSNLVSDRSFRYGDPAAAFAAAARRVKIAVRYPRNSGTPLEGLVALAEYRAGGYEVMANFQGPFAMHPVMALALKVPGTALRIRTPPDSGGSFGVKHALVPMIVLLCAAARIAGRPVKWVEDRREHLTAATAATNRVTTLEAALDAHGVVTALAWDQLEDCGAYLRAPEPATLYRMHGNMSGAYRVANLAIRNRVVLTNKTPSGLVRGFGGPQVYFALERLMQRIACETGVAPLEIVRRNLVPAAAFPYRCPAGAVLDSGDFQAAVAHAVEAGGLAELEERRAALRRAGRLYGIGFAAAVEPSVSNMGYITTVLTHEERVKAGPKSGALASATVALDPLGGVAVSAASVPQGQGHATVLAATVAAVFGLAPAAVRVTLELDTAKDAWSIAAGNYSSRFAAAVAGTAHLAALRLRERLARLAAAQLNVAPAAVRFADGRVFAADNPANALAFARLAGSSHWSAATLPEGAEPALRETVFWSPPALAPPSAADEINSSLTHGFVFDYCGVEIERDTGRLSIDRYVTVHDAGRLLNRRLAEGQVEGGFAQGLGAALCEELVYGPDGAFLAGSFADYLIPTACEVPAPLVLHRETPSPVTPLGAKGIAEGSNMSTPVCLANAAADALDAADIELPMTPARLLALVPRAGRGAGPGG